MLRAGILIGRATALHPESVPIGQSGAESVIQAAPTTGLGGIPSTGRCRSVLRIVLSTAALVYTVLHKGPANRIHRVVEAPGLPPASQECFQKEVSLEG